MDDPTLVRRRLRRAAAGAAASLLILAPLHPARASNLLGLYVGGAAGQARVEADTSGFFSGNAIGNFREDHAAYKLMLGVRALSLFGAEVEYVDLGHPRWSAPSLPGFPAADVSTKGGAAFGMFYLPIPLPAVDVFLKAGVARLDSRVTASFCAVDVCRTESRDLANTGFAAGAGVQFKVSAWAVRGEYERFNAAGANPGLLTLGMTWSFL